MPSKGTNDVVRHASSSLSLQVMNATIKIGGHHFNGAENSFYQLCWGCTHSTYLSCKRIVSLVKLQKRRYIIGIQPSSRDKPRADGHHTYYKRDNSADKTRPEN